MKTKKSPVCKRILAALYVVVSETGVPYRAL